MGKQSSVDEFDSQEYYWIGTTSIYNFQSHRNDDGSVDVSFTASNSTKRYTEITVYDSNGNIVSRESLEGQKDPTSVSGVFKEFGKGIYDLATGKFAHADGEFSNSKKDYSYTIPEGGYIQITEDPDAMDYGAYKQEVINSYSSKAVDTTLDMVDVDTGNAVVDFGVEIAKGVMTKNVKDQIEGKDTSPDDYVEEVASTAIDETVDAVTTAGTANPAGLGMLGIKCILKGNEAFEQGYVRNHQQNKSKGNGSLFIYG